MRRLIPTPPHVDVWEEFEQDFIQDWDDTNAHYKAAAELDKLKMEGVRLKLAFCTTCAVRVLVLAQGPSF